MEGLATFVTTHYLRIIGLGNITECWQWPSITYTPRANNADWVWVRSGVECSRLGRNEV